MSKKQNSLANLKPFKKGPDPRRNTTGKNRKLVSTTINEMKKKGVVETNAKEVHSVYLMLIQLTIDELKDVSIDSKESALVHFVSKEILSGKGFEIIEKMLDRAIGKATNTLDIKGEMNVTNVPMTDEQIKELNKKLNSEY